MLTDAELDAALEIAASHFQRGTDRDEALAVYHAAVSMGRRDLTWDSFWVWWRTR